MTYYSFLLADGRATIIHDIHPSPQTGRLVWSVRPAEPGEQPTEWNCWAHASTFSGSMTVCKRRSDAGLQTRLVRGWVPAEERIRGWITSPVEHGEQPTEGRMMTVRALVYDGALIPGWAPGYMQRTPQHPDEVLDADSLMVWEPQPDGVYRLGDRCIRVTLDASGSVVYVEPESAEKTT